MDYAHCCYAPLPFAHTRLPCRWFTTHTPHVAVTYTRTFTYGLPLLRSDTLTACVTGLLRVAHVAVYVSFDLVCLRVTHVAARLESGSSAHCVVVGFAAHVAVALRVLLLRSDGLVHVCCVISSGYARLRDLDLILPAFTLSCTSRLRTRFSFTRGLSFSFALRCTTHVVRMHTRCIYVTLHAGRCVSRLFLSLRVARGYVTLRTYTRCPLHCTHTRTLRLRCCGLRCRVCIVPLSSCHAFLHHALLRGFDCFALLDLRLDFTHTHCAGLVRCCGPLSLVSFDWVLVARLRLIALQTATLLILPR